MLPLPLLCQHYHHHYFTATSYLAHSVTTLPTTFASIATTQKPLPVE
jgi:hypothetical protein